MIIVLTLSMPPRIAPGGVLRAGRPSERSIRFMDVSKSAGVDLDLISVSATWVDFDDDGLLDLFVCNGYNQRDVLYRNRGDGSFDDVTEAAGLMSYEWSTHAQWLDCDNDGYIELFLHSKRYNQVFRNTGRNIYSDVTNLFRNLQGVAAIWADFNNDGHLDCYAGRRDINIEKKGSPPDLLYKWIGENQYDEMGIDAGVAGEADFNCANWVDFNNDGFLDIFVINTNRQPDHLYRNMGNETFVDVFSHTGIHDNDGTSLWGDFNNDGRIDLFIAEYELSALCRNEGDGTFKDVTKESGITLASPTSCWVDVDNDGYLDLQTVVDANAYGGPAIHVFFNSGNGSFREVSLELGDPPIPSIMNSAWGDYDQDGDLDLYLTGRAKNRLYQNAGGMNHWIKIQPVGNRSNRDAIGARVKVMSGALKQFRDVGIGHMYQSPTRQTLQFGLGQNTIVDSIIVAWPSGVIQDTCHIPVDQTIRIEEENIPQFTDITKISGLSPYSEKSYGVAMVDVDGDRYPDMLICNHVGKNIHFKNMGSGIFQEMTHSKDLEYSLSWSAVGYADFDNDGFGDLYVADAVYMENLFLQNTGTGSFRDITESTGTAGNPICSYDLALGDFDKNGFLDIYVGNDGPNVLYLNQGDFKFFDMTASAAVGDSLIGYCTAADYDNDGDLDIYAANNRGGYDAYPIKHGWPNRLYRNDGKGIFTDVAFEARVQDTGNSKGCCFGDYDNDGDLDLYVGNDGGSNRLYRNDGDGSFTDVTREAGVEGPEGTHGVVFSDFDNDGFLDIYAAGGSYIPERHDESVTKDHPDRFYRNNGDGTFTDRTRAAGAGFNRAMSFGISAADIDNDGDMDVLVANTLYRGMKPAANVLLRNNGNANHWIHFRLIGRESNGFAVGARVDVISGDLVQIREVSGGHGAGSMNSLPVEFGLGARTHVEQAIIRWPSGIVQKLKNPGIDRMHNIEEPYQLGPVQLSTAAFKRLRLGFLILFCMIFAAAFGISILLLGIKRIAARRKKRKEKAETVTLALKKEAVPIEKPKIPADTVPVPHLLIKIDMLKFRDEYLLTYIVKPDHCDPAATMLFENRSSERTPYPIREIKILRLRQQIDQMWQQYSQYISRRSPGSDKPIDLLKDIGDKIYHYFGMTGLFMKIFSLKEDQDLHVEFMIDNALIPWFWAYSTAYGRFLCNHIPYGLSFPSIQEYGQGDENIERRSHKPSRINGPPHALIFYGDWKGHFKELSQTMNEIVELQDLLSKSGIQVHTVYKDCDLFAEEVNKLGRNGENIRLIHYSGHITHDALELGEDEFMPVRYLKDTYGLHFESRPVVFLNGCRSGELKNIWRKQDNLATGFLECGASACIVTHFSIPEISARRFASRFYHYYIIENLSVGRSMQRARVDMARAEYCCDMDPEYDITRYFYDLYGDPRMKL